MEWARCPSLTNPDYFLVTEALLNVEREIEARGGQRQTDALYITRRFEYPWVFLQIPSDTKVVLDAGGGPATFQYLLSQNFPFVHNIDLNSEWVDKVNNVKRVTGMFGNLTIEQGDLSDLSSVPDNMFDVTICVSVLEHSDKTKITQIIDELLRVTKETVLITMDVGVDDSEFVNPAILHEIGQRYGFTIPPIPHNVFQPIKAETRGILTLAYIKLVKQK